ncbi:MAG: nitrate reductase cytochrome c-type subunit [Azoarcus sp.]|jgi:cytochrome c-type protein NapB|nr:nitrate reductase cytochrome c-type subunit [Azoarcus sp.]
MKKRFLTTLPATVLATGLMMLSCASWSADDGGLATLRGKPISAQDNTVYGDGLKKALDTEVIDRNFTDQPPLISHKADDYPITREFNKCLDCHSAANAKKEKATKVPPSHYEDARGKKLSNVSSRRYFCVQCHVPQVDAKPLVANTFQPAATH